VAETPVSCASPADSWRATCGSARIVLLVTSNDEEPTMSRRISATIRLLGVTLALAAGIAGFSSTTGAPASPHLAVATSFAPAGQ
jgi:hypothetical protein